MKYHLMALTMLEKLNNSSPYNIFYNKISLLENQSGNSEGNSNLISFSDLLCPSLGNLKCSLQITGEVDIQWLHQEYENRSYGKKPLTVLHNVNNAQMEKYINEFLPHVTCHHVTKELNVKYGPHHPKIGIYIYDNDSLRIAVSTANLLKKEWDHFSHSFWVSPLCPRLACNTSGDSPTNFKADLLSYLKRYDLPSILNPWIHHVTRADFSDVKVILITSFPGVYSPEVPGSHLQQMSNALRLHRPTPEKDIWPIIAQASNIGTLGESPDVWLKNQFLERLQGGRGELRIVFPTWKQAKNGVFDKKIVAEGIRYFRQVHEKQLWIHDLLYRWRADSYDRTEIMPHCKIYCQVSPDVSKIAWFLLTSSNLNKGAWGQEHHTETQEKNGSIYVRNYEVGVLFLPKFFQEEHFLLKASGQRNGKKCFPLLFDLPLTKYDSNDCPWSTWKGK